MEPARKMYPLNEPRPFPVNQWWMAAYSHEVGRTLIQRTLLDQPVVMYRTLGGEAVVLAGLCPHRLFPLVNGWLEGDILQGGYHGFTFDRTGRCTRVPSQPDTPPHFAVRRYPVVEHGNLIWIWTGTAPPPLPPAIADFEAMGLGNTAWAVEQHPLSTIRARYQLLVDNLLDLSHISFVHSASIVGGGVYVSRLKSGFGTTNCAQLRPALPFDPVIINFAAGCGTTETTSKSTAAFADGSFQLTEKLSLLGGARLTRDKVESDSFSVIDPNYPPGPGPNGFVVPYAPRALATGETSKTDWSGRIGLEFRPATDIMLFGTVARGYLGPTVTFSGLSGAKSEVKPQTVRDVTIGAKTQWFDRRLTLNGDWFFDRYKDLQTSVFNGFEFLTENAGGFDAKGFEIEVGYRITPQLSVNASYTYSHTEFTDYVTACPNNIIAQGAVAVAAQCNAPGSTASTALFQASGFPLTGAPKNSATLGADFRQPIGASLLLDADVNYYYRSDVYYDVANSLSVQGGYGIVGAKLGIGSANGKWRVGAFIRNAGDKRFHSAVIGLPFADAGGEVNWNTRDGRRTAGISIEAKF